MKEKIIQFLSEFPNPTDQEILARFPNHKVESVKRRIREARQEQKTSHKTLYEEVEEDRVIKKLKDGSTKEKQKNKILIDYISTLEAEKEAILEIKGGAVSRDISIPSTTEKGEATALWLASDWHVGEKVTFGQTNGINEYNPKIAKERGERFFRNALKLTSISGAEVNIKTVVLALLGDFVTNHLHEQNIETNYMAPIEETIYAQNIIISGLEYVLKHSKYNLTLVCVSGNHARTTDKVRFGSENGHSLEYFMYCSIANYFRNEKRITVIIPEGAHAYINVYTYTVRFLHGHDIKYGGGVGGITIPINKAIAQWDRARQAYLTCCGHFHQLFDGGSFLVNGSMIGYNAFALSIKASAERPAQRFCLIDKTRGKTITAPILFDKG